MNGATTIFVTDADNREVLEYDGSSGAIQRWYAYGIGANAVLNQTNVVTATRTALIPDIQGSIIATLDSAAGVLTKTGYLPYGESANAPNSFGYTSQRIDPETNGLYYYRARHYSPVLGRFLQTDPTGTKGGINLYAYVNNDPLNNTDRRGLASDEPDENSNTGIATSAGGAGGGGGAQAPPPPDAEDPDDEENEAGETYFRTMTQADFNTLSATGNIPATGETFVSTNLAYAQTFNGVTVQFTVNPGTTNSLLDIGVRSSNLTAAPYGSLPIVESGWTADSAYFKYERGVLNIGLGQGPALSLFNSNVINYSAVPQ